MLDENLGQIHQLLINNQLIVFAGAGVSIFPPSNASLWTKIRTDLFSSLLNSIPNEILIPSKKKIVLEKIDKSNIKPEVAFQAVFEECNNVLFKYLSHLLAWGSPNFCHETITELLRFRYIPAIITSNFDCYFEDALEACGLLEQQDYQVISVSEQAEAFLSATTSAPIIFKIHGTLNKIETMIATLYKAAILDSHKRALLSKLCSKFSMLVVGYSGNDDDIWPVIEDVILTNRCKKVFWNTYPGAKETELIRITRLLESNKKLCCRINFDLIELFQSISKSLHLKQLSVKYKKQNYKDKPNFDYAHSVVSRETKPENAILSVARILGHIGEYKLHREFLELGLRFVSSTNNLTTIAKYRTFLGSILQTSGDHEQGLDNYLKSLKIYQKLRDATGEALCYNNIATIYDEKGEYPKALKYYKKSLKLRQKNGQEMEEARVLNNIGLVYLSRGNLNRTLKLLKQSLTIRRKTGDRIGEPVTLQNLGLVYYRLGMIEESIEYYHLSIEIRENIFQLEGLPSVLCELGGLFHMEGRYDEAEKTLKKAEQICGRLELKKRLADVCLLISRNSVLRYKDELRFVSFPFKFSKIAKKTFYNYSLSAYLQTAEFYAQKCMILYGELNDNRGLADAEEVISMIRDFDNQLETFFTAST